MKLRIKSKEQPRAPSIPMALDSGAHSIYNRFLAAKDKTGKRLGGQENIEKANFDYVGSPEFRKYVDGYMQFLTATKPYMQFQVTLDIIYNPEATWEVYKEFRAAGFDVLPVYHFGEDPKWLKKYMDETDYIGVGGLGQNNTKQTWLPFGERTWKIICDAKGRPRCKVHGFAMSSFDLMSRWPWYSVDSTTAFTFSRMGAVTLPHSRRDGNGFNFSVTPVIFPVSVRRGKSNRHIGHRGEGHVKQAVEAYLAEVKLTLADVGESYVARDIANLYFMNRCMEEISATHSERLGGKYVSRYYASGSPTATMAGFLATLEHLQEHNALSHLCYLGTYFPGMRRPTTYLLEHWHGVTK